jgi:copper resistance protein B
MSTMRSTWFATAAIVLLAPAAPAQEHQHHHDMPPPAAPQSASTEPTQSEQEHVPPDPPTSQDDHPMSYREMARQMEMDDTSATGKLLFDRLEWRDTHAGNAFAWNAEAWYGNDAHKLWLKTEGERENGATTTARTELLWDRPFARWWNLQAGVRHDSASGDSRDWAAAGVQGIAPGFFDIEATAYIGDSGRTAARLSAERDLLLTQRLILQPEAEINLYGKDDPANQIGAGLSDLEVALRLRYELRREFSTYAGIVWARRFGKTADLVQAAGEASGDLQALAGFRIWF